MGYFQPIVIYRNPEEDRKDSVIRYIGNRVLRSNKNFLCAVVGCLSKDTILYGQTKTLGELYKSGNIFIDTYSLTKVKDKMGTYYPIKSKSTIVSSGKKEVFEIELENGKKVIATSEHKFFKQNKQSIEEVELKDLKVGDKLRDFPKEYIDNFFNRANERQKKKTKEKFNHKKICDRCHSLFYIELASGKTSQKYCKTCKEKFYCNRELKNRRHENFWYEWEDNLLRQFYYDREQKFINDLMPHRNWSGIMHRAIRLKLRRNPKFNRKNDWTSKDNPMNDIQIRKKVSCSLQGINLNEWNGFKSFEPYTSDFNDKFKEIVKLRDNYLCLECGISEQKHLIINGKKLSIHHIDYVKENSYLNNCVTLCSVCHMKTNTNRKYWIDYFKEKLSKLYNYSYLSEVENVYNKNKIN